MVNKLDEVTRHEDVNIDVGKMYQKEVVAKYMEKNKPMFIDVLEKVHKMKVHFRNVRVKHAAEESYNKDKADPDKKTLSNVCGTVCQMLDIAMFVPMHFTRLQLHDLLTERLFPERGIPAGTNFTAIKDELTEVMNILNGGFRWVQTTMQACQQTSSAQHSVPSISVLLLASYHNRQASSIQCAPI